MIASDLNAKPPAGAPLSIIPQVTRMTALEAGSHYSSAREKVLEHIFVGELLRSLWLHGIYDVEVLRSESDRSGYDVVIECNSVLRHIQLKSTYRDGKASRQTVNVALSKKPSGCVVWMIFDPDTLNLDHFLWFGDEPNRPIPYLGQEYAKHTKGNAQGIKMERPKIRVLKRSAFTRIRNYRELSAKLFGIDQRPCQQPSPAHGTEVAP